MNNDKLASIEDIDYNTAYHAHTGTSFSPEKRAEQERNGYAETVNGFADMMIEFVLKKDESKLAELADCLADYKAGYLKRKIAHLHSKSNCISTMITGPANFPVRRAEKANNAEHNKLTALCEYQDNSKRYILKKLGLLTGGTISSDDEQVIEKLESKLAGLEGLQVKMKAANKIVRSKTMKNADIVEKLEEIGFSLEDIYKMQNPKYHSQQGYASFELTNNNAKIKSTKQRIESLKHLKSHSTHTEQCGDVLFVDNVDANRCQFYLERKPTPEEKTVLKRNAFKYSPRAEYEDEDGNTYNGAWQRQRSGTANLRWALKEVGNMFKGQGE